MSHSHPRAHHYLPQMLLKHFSFDKTRKNPPVVAYDKITGKVFRPGIKNICNQRDFYKFEDEKGTFCIEDNFGKIEAACAPLVDKVVDTGRIDNLSSSEREMLMFFTAAQQARGVGKRNVIFQLGDLIRARLGGSNPVAVAELFNNQEQIKKAAILSLPREFIEYTRHYASKDMVLLHDPSSSLFIGDEPVAMDNRQPSGPYGNIGLAIRGIEIYFPLSPSYALAFLCKSIQKDREANLMEFDIAYEMSNRGEGDLPASFFTDNFINYERDRVLTDQIRASHSVRLDYQNVTYLNSLQVMNADRYIISCKEEFALVEEMIRKDSRYQRGRQISIS